LAGVIFDMDGVLCDSEDFMAEAAAKMFADEHGIVVGVHEFTPFRGMGEERYLGDVAKIHGVTLDIALAKERAYGNYLELIKGRLKPLPGVPEFVALCRSKGLKLAVATSADRVKLFGTLAEIFLPQSHFNAIVTGTEVTHKKPNPEIFLTAARLIGLSSDVCLVIEDARSGVLAAKAAGSRCLAVTTSLDEATLRSVGADWVATNLVRVPDGVWGN
jgi:HAD superfamily hydrolase (TIGR01509 family)